MDTKCIQMKEGCTHLRCVVSEPVVGLSEVVENDLVTIVALGREDDRWTGISLGRDPRAMECVVGQDEANEKDDTGGDLRH